MVQTKKTSTNLNRYGEIIHDFEPAPLTDNSKVVLEHRYLLKDENISQGILEDPSVFVEYENENFIIINKPSGIAVHSGTNQKFDFLSSLRRAYKQNELSLVHRLDKDTSGCLLISKNYKSL